MESFWYTGNPQQSYAKIFIDTQIIMLLLDIVVLLRCRSSSTIARYIVNFEKESSEVKGSGRDLSTIGSNKVESGKNPLTTKEQEEIAPIKLTITDLQKLVAMALQEDKSLPMDLGTLQFIDGQ